MLTKLPLPAVIGVFLLTATTALTSTTTTTATRTASTATVNSVAVATTSPGKVAAEVTRNGNETASGSGSVKDVPVATLATNNSATQDVTELEHGRRTKTTTSLLPLQPPLNVTSTTTSTFLTPTSGSTAGKLQLPLSGPPQSKSQSRAKQPSTQKSLTQPGSTKYSAQIRALRQSNVNTEKANVVKSGSNILQHDSTKKVLPDISHLLPTPVIEVDTEKKPWKSVAPSGHSGYIHFDVSGEDGSGRATATPTRATRTETVNEVLSNLFPNGFTDIFRFSYASEQPTPAHIATSDEGESPKQPTTTTSSTEIKLTPVPSSTTTTTTTENPRGSRANRFFSYETSVSKEYRRELSPGHTEIVVEKLELLPHGTSTSSGEFRDGSNLITKEDLQRINRAAVDSPVLPSLLMKPSQGNTTTIADQPVARQVPIIILNDDDSADMEGISAEDNLIAESQNVGQRVYQRLPLGDKPYGFKIGVERERLLPESEVNIKVVHEVLPEAESSINQRPIYVPEEHQAQQQTIGGKAEASLRVAKVVPPSQQLDTFQEHAEQSFRHRNLVQEAPSRNFLRNFNPVLSTDAGSSTPKGSFHYEAHSLQPSYHVQVSQIQEMKSEKQAAKQGEDGGVDSTKVLSEPPTVGVEHVQQLRLPLQQFDKDAAQLRYFKEQQHLQQQQQVLQQQQQLLLQQQQQEQQRQQHESLIQQQKALQQQEKRQQLHQQQQQQEKELRQQKLFQPPPQYHQQQQQQFHKDLRQQQQTPLSQQYAIFQQHPPPQEYRQWPEKQQEQRKQEEGENARKQNQQQEEQLNRQQQQAEQQQRLKQQASQQQRSEHSQQQQYANQPKPLETASKLHTKITGDSEPASASLNHQAYQPPLHSALQHSAPGTPTPHSVVFVTLNTPTSQATRGHSSRPTFTQKSPYEYVSEATGAVTHNAPTVPPTPAAIVKRPHGGYTFVEVQKSVNIHNKLITEKDGKLVEEHETIYPLPQYATHQQQFVVAPDVQPASAPPTHPPTQNQPPKPTASQTKPTTVVPYNHYPAQYAQQLAVLEEGVHAHDYYFVPKEYVSLSANPINVQHIDEPEQQEEAASYTHLEQVLPLHDQEVPQPHGQPFVGHKHEHPQQYVQYSEHYIQQPADQQSQHEQKQQLGEQMQQHAVRHPSVQIDHQMHQELLNEKQHQPAPDKATTETVIEHQVEKIVERPVHIPYPVHVQQYIDRPYPVKEIVETHIPVPYPVPEPVAVPVHVDRYIDRPYPVEKIVEKRVPYPVEKVVERIVEKEIPIEVEKIVEKVVDRPVPIPIRVPVAIHVPYAHQPLPEYNDHAEIIGAPYHSHPNALGWPEPTGLADFGGRNPVISQIPPKVLQNYYARMLKKLLPKVLPQRGASSSATKAATATATKSNTHTQSRPKAPTSSTTTSFKSTKQQKPVTPSSTSGSGKQHSFKIGDMRFDLKPPPLPPTGSEWLQGSRYLYNTLPHDLSVADSSGIEQLAEAYTEPFAPHNEPYDEFQRWRNGHNLKRSPQFGRNLQMEYGFKPPLVPSVEINDQGIPLNADAKQAEQ